MAIIKDGSTGFTAGVNSQNQMEVRAVTESSAEHAAGKGIAWELNTGNILITGDATLIFLKNTDDLPFVVEFVVLGMSGGITYNAAPNDVPYITILKSPTDGDLITDALELDINQNRNFSFTDRFGGTVCKGKVGGTITGGDGPTALLMLEPTGRSFFPLGFVIPKQASMAITLAANLNSGSANLYTAIIGYFNDDGHTA